MSKENTEEVKRAYKDEIKEWWNTTGKTIFKCAACCGVAWLFGFVKGTSTTVDMFTRNGKYVTVNNDRFEYDEKTVDDPELLELIRLEEEADKSEGDT